MSTQTHSATKEVENISQVFYHNQYTEQTQLNNQVCHGDVDTQRVTLLVDSEPRTTFLSFPQRQPGVRRKDKCKLSELH